MLWLSMQELRCIVLNTRGGILRRAHRVRVFLSAKITQGSGVSTKNARNAGYNAV
jgi:hypothetical protein